MHLKRIALLTPIQVKISTPTSQVVSEPSRSAQEELSLQAKLLTARTNRRRTMQCWKKRSCDTMLIQPTLESRSQPAMSLMSFVIDFRDLDGMAQAILKVGIEPLTSLCLSSESLLFDHSGRVEWILTPL